MGRGLVLHVLSREPPAAPGEGSRWSRPSRGMAKLLYQKGSGGIIRGDRSKQRGNGSSTPAGIPGGIPERDTAASPSEEARSFPMVCLTFVVSGKNEQPQSSVRLLLRHDSPLFSYNLSN